ncbi:MAG: transposase [Planctomycetes bacterium]|nr:transposase [Planctomycetota bacterium]
MAFNNPIAYLLTWTTYATRLHGAENGSHDADTNDRGGHFVPPSFRYENLRRSQAKELPFILDAKCRGAVFRALMQHADYREWHVFAVNIRTNHVHLVVSAGAEPAELLRQFKAYATRGLRAAELIPDRTRVWTEGGSRKWLFTRDHVDAACDYVLHQQGDDLPME